MPEYSEPAPADPESVNDSPDVCRLSIRRRRFVRVMVAGLVVAIVLGPWLFYRITSPLNRVRISATANEQRPPEFQGQLRVMTWNIAHGRGAETSNLKEGRDPKIHRIMEIARVIRELDADIVVLNEVDFAASWSGGFDQATLLAEQSGLPFLARQTNLDCGYWFCRWQFGNAVLSRYPITEAEIVHLKPMHVWEDWLAGSKRGVLCTIQLTPGKSIRVMGVHLEHRSEEARLESVHAVSEVVADIDGPLLIAGDLNTTPAEAPRANLTADGQNAFDVLTEKTGLKYMPVRLPEFEELTFPSWAPHTAIDWILYHPDFFRPVDHRVIRSPLSDHLPVLDTFELTSQ